MKKTAATAGVTVVDDKSRIETKGRLEAANTAAEKYCGDFQEAVEAFKKGNAFSGAINGKAILASYSDPDGNANIPPVYGRNGRC